MAVLILAPLISLVTWVATTVDALPFLLFPPLAAAAYRLFAYPEKPGNFPWQFPLALTVGAASGAVSELVARTYFAPVPQGSFQVDPVTAGLTVLLAGGFLYLFDTELSPSLAVGLLLPFAGVSAGVYVANVSLASSFVAVAFSVWRTYLLD